MRRERTVYASVLHFGDWSFGHWRVLSQAHQGGRDIAVRDLTQNRGHFEGGRQFCGGSYVSFRGKVLQPNVGRSGQVRHVFPGGRPAWRARRTAGLEEGIHHMCDTGYFAHSLLVGFCDTHEGVELDDQAFRSICEVVARLVLSPKSEFLEPDFSFEDLCQEFVALASQELENSADIAPLSSGLLS